MSISDLFRRPADVQAIDLVDRSPTSPTKALSKLLAKLRSRGQSVLLDLGPVVGQNITFFGEHLQCKIFVEDLFHDIDRHVRDRRSAELPVFFASKFRQPDASVDGVLAWDVFDYLEPPAGHALASELVRLLRPDGLLLAFFGTAVPRAEHPVYTKRIVVDPLTLQTREYPAARAKQLPLLNRAVIRMFEPLEVSEQFLMKTNVRELLFRKPGA